MTVVEAPGGAGFCFTKIVGTPIDPSSFAKAFSKATEVADLGSWSPHEFRHTAASLMIASGVPLKQASEAPTSVSWCWHRETGRDHCESFARQIAVTRNLRGAARQTQTSFAMRTRFATQTRFDIDVKF